MVGCALFYSCASCGLSLPTVRLLLNTAGIAFGVLLGFHGLYVEPFLSLSLSRLVSICLYCILFLIPLQLTPSVPILCGLYMICGRFGTTSIETDKPGVVVWLFVCLGGRCRFIAFFCCTLIVVLHALFLRYRESVLPELDVYLLCGPR